MADYTEIEGALKELLQNIELVPGTLPPVYTCDGFVISIDGRGRIKIIGSATSQASSSQPTPRPKRQTGWLGQPPTTPQPEQPEKESWLRRWSVRYGRAVKLVTAWASLGFLLLHHY